MMEESMDRPHYLSRMRLRRDPGAAGSLSQLLREVDDVGAVHRLIWSLFAEDGGEHRDFLFRQTGPGDFYALSARQPVDRNNLWQLETKEFAPALNPGDRLGFSLRANPVVTRRADGAGSRQQRHDVVMNHLATLPPRQRADHRAAAEQEAGQAWLSARGFRHGFNIADGTVHCDGYTQHQIGRARGNRPIRFSTLDFEGELTVTDPLLFGAMLGQGLGPAKAYGCGLMLIRRV